VDRNREAARSIQRTMRQVNPDTYLVAEHPFDASADLLGDGWHGTMAYAAFTRPLWCWLGQPGMELDFLGMPVPLPSLPGGAVARSMTTFRAAVPWRAVEHNLNLLDSHDTARFRSLVGGRERQAVGAGLLFASPGIPSVLAGDEVGLTGSDHEAGRQPFPWDAERWDTDTLEHYRRLAAVRRSSHALRRGGFRWVHVGPHALTFLRESSDERVLVHAARATGAAIAVPAGALGVTDGAPAESLLDDADLRAEGGMLRLPADGPAFHLWRLPGRP
jgi:alpha-glucosidase